MTFADVDVRDNMENIENIENIEGARARSRVDADAALVVDLCTPPPSPGRWGGERVGDEAREAAARGRRSCGRRTRKGERPMRATVIASTAVFSNLEELRRTREEVEATIARLRAEVDDIRRELTQTGGETAAPTEAVASVDEPVKARKKTARVTMKVAKTKEAKEAKQRKMIRPRRGCREPEKPAASELDPAEVEALVPRDPSHNVLGCSKCRWALAGCALCRKHPWVNRSNCPPLRERAGFKAYARRFGYIVPALSNDVTARRRIEDVDFKSNPVMTLEQAMAKALVVTSMKEIKGRSPFEDIEVDRFIFPDGTRGVRFFLKKRDEKPALAIIGAETKKKDGHYEYFKVSTFQAGAPLGRCTSLNGVEDWLRRHVSCVALIATRRWHHSRKGKHPSNAPPQERAAKKQKL